jgi:hypothetical protein
MPREPGLRVSAEAGPGLPAAPDFVSISTIGSDSEAVGFADSGRRGFGTASGHVHDVTDMVPV